MIAADAQFESRRMNIFILTYFHITAHFLFFFKQQQQKNPITVCQGSKSFNMTQKTSSFGCCTTDTFISKTEESRAFWHRLLIVFVKKTSTKTVFIFLDVGDFCVCVFWSLQLFCLWDGGKQDQHDDMMISESEPWRRELRTSDRKTMIFHTGKYLFVTSEMLHTLLRKWVCIICENEAGATTLIHLKTSWY